MDNNRKAQIYEAFEPVRVAKQKAIRSLTEFGKKNSKLRIPIFVVTVAFIFLYNFFYHLFMQMRIREKMARTLAMCMVVVLTLTSVYIPAAAFDGEGPDENVNDMCINHPVHDDSCGYVEAVEGHPCEHVHTDECFDVTVECTHTHDESCYEDVYELTCGLEEAGETIVYDVSGEEIVEYIPGHTHTEDCYVKVQKLVCAHECTEDSGCVIVTLICRHEHDDVCGYVEAVEGHPCEHSCELCDGSVMPEDEADAEEPAFSDDPVTEDTVIEEQENDEEETETEEIRSEESVEDEVSDVSSNNGEHADNEEIDENEETDTEETEQSDSEDEENVFTEFNAKTVVAGVEISVYAPAGVFPEGVFLQADIITDSEAVDRIERMVSDKKDSDNADVITTVEKSYSFDIKIIDGDGNELEPDLSYGQVLVSFKNVGAIEAEDSNKELSVFYVTDDHTQIEEISSDVDTEEDVASIVAEHFSIYTVVITSGAFKSSIMHYYQGTSRAESYFTIYNETQLLKYRDLLNGYVSGTLKATDSVETILVNSDDSNPTDGITGDGQSSNIKVSDLNFSVKILDNIMVTALWTPIANFPEGITFEGDGYTLDFTYLTQDTLNSANQTYGVLINACAGTVRNVTIKWGSNTRVIPTSGPEDDTEYVTVTVRVDGKKSDIGGAIVGAETLAISADGENYITLERSDDHSVYRTLLEYLEEGLEYYVYYVYEDENETISAAVLSTEKKEAELNYVSVTYDLEYANTYSMVDGILSENVMSAVRVIPQGSTYVALEDYDTIVMAIEGHEVPTRAKNVSVSVNGNAISDYSYTYDTTTKQGALHIAANKITGPIYVTVKADSLEDSPSNVIILKTIGGSVADPIWEKSSTEASTYTLTVYEDTLLPTDVTPINGSTYIRFAGWYTNIGCTGSAVTKYSYVNGGNTQTYYAKWVIANASGHNNTIQYLENGGRMDVRGYNPEIKTTFSNSGYQHVYRLVGGSNTDISMASGSGSDIFVQLGSSNIYVALVYTLESNFVNITYIFENRGSTPYNSSFWFGEHADVQIGSNDYAPVEYVSAGTSSYITMENDSQVFRLYTTGANMGITPVTRWWYGGYGSRTGNLFDVGNNPTSRLTNTDSGITFSWNINESIPAYGYITRTTKMGVGNASNMNKVEASIKAGSGKFSDNTVEKVLSSDQAKIAISSTGTITAYNSSGNISVNAPTKVGYVFSYWSVNAEGGTNVNGRTLTENVTLFANYVPKPDKKVINASSIQKVNGSTSLLVPEAVGNIIITNTTPGATSTLIKQGETAEEAAGYASGFTGIISIEGADDRYLLPDDIEIYVVEANGNQTRLTRGTAYEYNLWNNKTKATLDIHKQYINGDVKIVAVGYELPPVTATHVDVSVEKSTIQYGERATFTAHAETSKNHVATYQWYVAPYYTITIDRVYWTYQNMDGEKLENGTYAGSMLRNASGNPITISGANKQTLRISGLDVSEFTGAANEYGLHVGGYHFYCVVTSTRNITGQDVESFSNTAEVEVTTSRYSAPTGLEGSSTSFYGSTDGSVLIEDQNRTTMKYKKNGTSTEYTVSAAQLADGKITGLSAGTYLFWYAADANNQASANTSVVVENGKPIVVTYRAPGADNEALRTQYKHVAYGSNVTAGLASLDSGDGQIVQPSRAGYTFSAWDTPIINNITANATVTAIYECGKYKITLNNCGGTAAQTEIYEKYSEGFYSDSACINAVSGTQGITVPSKEGYNFLGFFTAEDGGTKMIGADGCLTENLSATTYLADVTLRAHWEGKPITFEVLPSVANATGTPGARTSGVVSMGIALTTPDADNDPEKVGYKSDISYDISLTNGTGYVANVLYMYSDGELKQTVPSITFNGSYKYTFTLVPQTIGGGNITFALGYIAPLSESGNPKTDEEIIAEANTKATELEYSIIYKEVNGSKTGTDFSGTFTDTAPETGIIGVASTLPGAIKSGYSFGGWFTAPRGIGSPIAEIPASNTSEEVTVYAKWTPNKYHIYLELNGGTIASSYEVHDQYEHGAENIVLPSSTEISKPNYEFLGWFDNANLLGNPITEVDCSQVGDVIYYAGWELLSLHTITLKPDNANGKIYTLESAPGYSTSVYHGYSYKFLADCASAYGIKAVKADGRVLTPDTDGTYTLATVIEDVTITVSYEVLASTADIYDGATATILLADGTTGFFDTLEAAISYATGYGTDSVITLQKNINNASIDAVSGRAFTLDLNGHSIGNASLLVEDGADITVKNSKEEATYSLSVENRGSFTNEITVASLQNQGIAINNGTVNTMTQMESEYYPKSKFVNNGSIGTAQNSAVLYSGYFVENVLTNAPAGLSGYHTIMNGNEYYYDFNDAVDIANESDEDATIKILSTVDNIGKTISIGNTHEKKITVDLNGFNISSGAITTSGNVAFENGKGAPTCISEISATVTSTGTLSVGNYVKISGNVENSGDFTVASYATVSSQNFENKEGSSLVNNGTVSAFVENNGKVINNGNINKITQNSGSVENKGTIYSRMLLNKGSYTVYPEASPSIPEGTVCKDNKIPVTYFGTFKDAVDAANEEENGPVVITILEDIGDLGDGDVVLDPSVPVSIELGGHELGGFGEKIQIGDGSGESKPVTFEGPGTINSDLEVEGDGEVITTPQTTVSGDVDNGGEFDNGGTITGNVNNEGTLNNEGDIDGTLTNTGDVDNNGDLGEVVMQAGTLKNGENGTVDNLEQTGGQTENEGTITRAEVAGGGYEGEGAEQVDGKVAYILKDDGTKVYFGDLESALEYAAKSEDENPVVKLIDNIAGETVDFTGTDRPVVLDLNGFDIEPSSKLNISEGTELTVLDDSNDGDGEIKCPVVNNGTLDNEGIISGNVKNNGFFDNEGTVTGTLENDGIATNEGTLSQVNQKDGELVNKTGGTTGTITVTGGNVENENPTGGISEVDLRSGSYEGYMPETPISNAEAAIGDVLYGDFETAVEAASKSDENVIIDVLSDVVLDPASELVVDNENGKTIAIDLNGNDISGGKLDISDAGNKGSKVIIEDSATPSGTVSTDIEVDDNAFMVVESGVEIAGDVENKGETVNKGTITGEMLNTGDVTNEGTLVHITQQGGTINNSENGTIEDLVQQGGTVNNEGDIDDATISGGIYNGDDAGAMDYDGAKVKVVTHTQDGDVTRYYPSVNDAIENIDSDATLTLIENISDEDIVIDKPGISIDLNGHQIDEESTITIAENASDTVIEDNSEGATGAVLGEIVNNGGLTIEENTSVNEVTNNGKLDNEGEITELTNKGEAENNGEIATVKQEEGKFENGENGAVETALFEGGSYIGGEPENGPVTGMVAKIGDTLYADLESAFEDANNATEQVTIVLLEDMNLENGYGIAAGNVNGKKIGLDLNGNAITGGTLEVSAPGIIVLDDDGEGVFETDVVVNEDARFEIGENVVVDGDIRSNGTVVNEGTITGKVQNLEDGIFTNIGEIDGDVTNGGTMTNTGDVLGDVTVNAGGEFVNSGKDSFVQGNISNAGTSVNEGAVFGKLDNTGSFTNSGNIEDDITNHGNGKLSNTGYFNGQTVNSDSATVNNNGNIRTIIQNGGTINNGENGVITEVDSHSGTVSNDGQINEAELYSLDQYEGKLPESGLDNVAATIVYTDETGEERTRYYDSFEHALDATENLDAKENTVQTIEPVTCPVEITGTVTIPENVKLVIDEGNELVVKAGGKLVINGETEIAPNAKLKIEEGATAENNGSLANNGNVENAGVIDNIGTLTNKGDVSTMDSGTVNNEGSFDNRGGSLNAKEGADGVFVNSGDIFGGTVKGPLENTETGTIYRPDKVSGKIENAGDFVVNYDADMKDIELTNLPGSHFETILPPEPEPEPESEPEPEPVVETTKKKPKKNTTNEEPETEETEGTGENTEGVEGEAENFPAGEGGTSGDTSSTEGDLPVQGVNILEESKVTEDEVRNYIASDTPKDKEKIVELLDKAVTAGNIETIKTEAETFAATLSEENIAQVLEEVLSPEEKIAVLSGKHISVRAEVKETVKEEIPIEVMTAASENVPEDMQVVTYIDMSLYRVADNEEKQISSTKTVKVTFEVPDEYKSENGEAVDYKVMRVYTTKYGETRTETVEIEQDGYFITLEADTESQYVIMVDGKIALAGKKNASTIEELTLEAEEPEKKNYWGLSALALSAGAGIFALTRRKRRG